ncbi:MAG: hypothetical protein K0R60_63 [Microbacterium sp.]|jgi:hypothetical protein|nr:hypothetical protein [Microbacterium sp.]
MALQTRKPTGLPSWPVVLLGGREKAGKTWTALHGSTSPLVGRTLYIGVGEDDPDEYSAIPGADFDIVLHDGTYAGIRGAVEDAVAEPRVDGKPTLIVFDSATRAWNLIVDNAQAVANRKAKGRQDPLTGDYSVTPDLWNAAAAQWAGIINPLLRHQGPVVVTARIDNVMVMRNGQPTQEKEWKIQSHKTLPFDASAVIEMHERGHFLLTGVRSARIALPEPRKLPGDFSLPWFWDQLGLAAGVGERSHSGIVQDSGLEDALAAIAGARTMAELQKVWTDVVKLGLGKEPELVEAKDVRKHELSAPAPTDAPAAVEASADAAVAPVAADEPSAMENTSPAEGDWPTADVPADEEALVR